MEAISSRVAGAPSSTAGKMPEGCTCLRTPKGAPSRSHRPRSGPGSPATRPQASNRTAFRPSSPPGSGAPRARATFTRSLTRAPGSRPSGGPFSGSVAPVTSPR
eukprot:15461510-Alexandrium_andersonii.AAC.1